MFSALRQPYVRRRQAVDQDLHKGLVELHLAAIARRAERRRLDFGYQMGERAWIVVVRSVVLEEK